MRILLFTFSLSVYKECMHTLSIFKIRLLFDFIHFLIFFVLLFSKFKFQIVSNILLRIFPSLSYKMLILLG